MPRRICRLLPEIDRLAITSRVMNKPRQHTKNGMTIENLPELYDAQPFRPFILHLRDGRRIRVTRRERIAYNLQRGWAGVFTRGEDLNFINLADVVHIESTTRKRTGR
jgi:hypothetical protein